MMDAFISVRLDSEGRLDQVFIKQSRGRELTVQYVYAAQGLQMQLKGDRSLFPTYADLLKMIDAKYSERIATIAQEPHVEELTRIEWLSDGSYAERWEQGFRKVLYHGRTGAFFRSESAANVPYKDWTIPEVVIGDNLEEPLPWQGALRMRNSIDGVHVDELYVGFPKAHQKQVICFAANLPSPATLDNLYIGFEVNSGGAFALIASLACIGGAWELRSVNYAGIVETAVVLRHPDVYARYALAYNEAADSLKLWQAPVANRYGFPLELTHTQSLLQAGLPTIRGKTIPFFANEHSAICEFRMSNVWIYELL